MAKNAMSKMANKKGMKPAKGNKKEYASMEKKPLSNVEKRKAGKEKLK